MPAGTKRKRSNNIQPLTKKPRLNAGVEAAYKSIIHSAGAIESPIEHLSKLIPPSQTGLIDLLMIADTCHDFRGRNTAEFNRLINPLIDTHDIDIFMKQYEGVTLNNIEDSTEAYFEKTVPHLIGMNPVQPYLVSLYDVASFRSADLSHLHNFELLYTESMQDSDALMQFFYKDYVTRTTPVYFSFDAGSYNIIYDIYKDTPNVQHLLTPQNVLDSARTNPEETFKNKTMWMTVDGIKATSNYFTQEFIEFYTGSSAYNEIIHFCKLGDMTIPIYTANHGPSVADLMQIMGCRSAYRECSKKIFMDTKSTDYSNVYAIVNSNDTLHRVSFDIKRMGDHEQANAVYYMNGTKTIFATIDRLASLYSRLIGNSTVLFKAARNSIVCYSGRVSYSEKDKLIDEIRYKVNAMNYIITTYPNVIDLIQNATVYIEDIRSHINYTLQLTDTASVFNLLVSIKLLDIIQLIENIVAAIGDIDVFNQKYMEFSAISVLMKDSIITVDVSEYNIESLRILNNTLDSFVDGIIANISQITKYISKLNTIIDPIVGVPVFNKPMFFSNGAFINNETFRFNISTIRNIIAGVERILGIPVVGRSGRSTMLKTAKRIRDTSISARMSTKIDALENKATELYGLKMTKKRRRELNAIMKKRQDIISANMKFKYMYDNPNINYNKTSINDIKLVVDGMLADYFSTLFNDIVLDSKHYTIDSIGQLIAEYIDTVLNMKLGQHGGGTNTNEETVAESIGEINLSDALSVDIIHNFTEPLLSTMQVASRFIYDIINKKYMGLSIKDISGSTPYVFSYSTFDMIQSTQYEKRTQQRTRRTKSSRRS